MTDKCDLCGGTDFIRDEQAGEIVCVNCGNVTEELVSLESEVRYYSIEDRDRLRTKIIDERISDRGFGTNIPVGRRDYAGRQLSVEQQRLLKRMSFHQRRVTGMGVSRNLRIAAGEMSKIVNKLQIPKHIHEHGMRIYRKAVYAQIVRGRTITGVALAALYAACRLNKNLTTLKEFSEASAYDKGDIARCYRILHKDLKLRPRYPKIKPVLGRLIRKLNLSGEVELFAVGLLDELVETKKHQGKDTKGISAALVYIACKHFDITRTQKMIAVAADVTEVTIRNRYQDILEILQITRDGYKLDRREKTD